MIGKRKIILGLKKDRKVKEKNKKVIDIIINDVIEK